MKILILSMILLFTSSCADFFKSDNSPDDPQRQCLNCGPEKLNPFPKGYDPNVGTFSEDKMLASIGLNAIVPMVQFFAVKVGALKDEVAAFCSQTNMPPANVSEVQNKWLEAAMAFHELNAAPLGPLVEPGRLLVDNIYGWPAFNPCGIDLEVARLGAGGEPNPQLLYTLKGLGALEYLLFDTAYGTQCLSKNPKNQPAFDWIQKSLKEKFNDRCKMALALTTDLNGYSNQLESGWNPERANFSNTLINGTRYASVTEAVTAMSDALFALEYVKDVKLGKPLGQHADCTNANDKCPESVEHKFSGYSIAAAVSQLKGFRTVFTGGFSRGFDDYLASAGHPEVSEKILALVDTAIKNGTALAEPGLLQKEIENMSPSKCKNTTVSNRLVPVCAFFQDVRQISIKMKTDFLTVLSIREPPTHGGDND